MTTKATTLSFADLGLKKELLSALSSLSYDTPTPIQAESIPLLIEGRDLLAQAQTGTGKTGAFALPLLQNIDIDNNNPQVLVLTPTRELGIQVAEAFKSYAKDLKGFKVLPIYGGQSMGQQLSDLKRATHVIVGTPGRVIDHLKRKTLKLDNIKAVVLDEADEMLKMGFIEDIDWILSETPEETQIALFSATMPPRIRKIAQEHLTDQAEVTIESKTQTVENIEQVFCVAIGKEKFSILNTILEVEEVDACLIFVKTKAATVDLVECLQTQGYSCSALNGDMNQSAREQTIKSLKNGRLNIVVATDVAARGLDVERISHVVNYDAPRDTESYVHRIGRTGRAGRSGRAILFVGPRETRLLSNIERTTRQRMTQIALPSKEELEDMRDERFKEKLRETITTKKLGKEHKIIAKFLEDGSLELKDMVAALYYIVHEKKAVPMPEMKEEETRGRGREDRDSRGSRNSEPREVEVGFIRYRIETGRRQGIRPANIVSGVASATGMSGSNIGRISLSDNHTTVELPQDLSSEMVIKLNQIWINNENYHAVAEGSDMPMPKREPSGRSRERLSGGAARVAGGKRSHRGSRPESNGNKFTENKTHSDSPRSKKSSSRPRAGNQK